MKTRSSDERECEERGDNVQANAGKKKVSESVVYFCKRIKVKIHTSKDLLSLINFNVSMKTWLKGAIVGLVIALIPICWGIMDIFIWAPSSQPVQFRGWASAIGYYAVFIGIGIIGLGAFIGFLVEKIKSK